MNDHTKTSLRGSVMEAIQKGRVRMRPRWHFVLLSALAALGAFIVFLTLLYVVSLAFFFLRESGAYFATSFGMRGWFVLLRSVPWLLMLFLVLFIGVLELLVRRFAFVYRRPLLFSVAGIVFLIFVGGFAVAQTHFHRRMFFFARHGQLLPLGMMYDRTFRPSREGDVYFGAIGNFVKGGFVVVDQNGAGTTTIVVTPATRLPYGADFEIGDTVVIVGDEVATGTVRAFGIREVSE